eukprot:Rhum_TRINITY_DN15248_c9_g1::Rhum_TRINITY_DN15248_c9_g1_i1::g.143934::m.143934
MMNGYPQHTPHYADVAAPLTPHHGSAPPPPPSVHAAGSHPRGRSWSRRSGSVSRGGSRSPAASVRGGGGLLRGSSYGAGMDHGFESRPLSEVNLSERDRCIMRIERRKKEVEREAEFRLRKRDVGYAERRFHVEVMQELGRSSGAAHEGYGGSVPPQHPHFHQQPQQQVAQEQNRYQKLYNNPQIYTDPAQMAMMTETSAASSAAAAAYNRWQTRCLAPFDEAEKSVVKRCVRCILESPYINHAGAFKGRIGFHRGDAKRLYALLCNDASDWSHYTATSNMWFLINNAMNEIVNNGVCTEWGRWFGNVSRRRVEDLYVRLEGSGKMITKYNGTMVELNTPGVL